MLDLMEDRFVRLVKRAREIDIAVVKHRFDLLVERGREINTEKAVAGLFLVIAVYMYVEALSFSQAAGLFPRAAAAATIVGSMLILTQDILPTGVRRMVAGDGQAFETPEMEVPTEDETNRPTDETMFDPTESALTAITIVGYVGLSYIIGFLYATPIFVLVYGHMKGLSRKVITALLAITFISVYGIGAALNIAVHEGALLIIRGIA